MSKGIEQDRDAAPGPSEPEKLVDRLHEICLQDLTEDEARRFDFLTLVIERAPDSDEIKLIAGKHYSHIPEENPEDQMRIVFEVHAHALAQLCNNDMARVSGWFQNLLMATRADPRATDAAEDSGE